MKTCATCKHAEKLKDGWCLCRATEWGYLYTLHSKGCSCQNKAGKAVNRWEAAQ